MPTVKLGSICIAYNNVCNLYPKCDIVTEKRYNFDEHILTTLFMITSFVSSSGLGVLLAEINLNCKRKLCWCLDRPPSALLLSIWSQILKKEHIVNYSASLFVLGDFYVNHSTNDLRWFCDFRQGSGIENAQLFV